DADDVEAERREHRLRDLTGLQCVRRGLELRKETPLAALPEVTAVLRRSGVGRFALRDVLELLTADDLGADLLGARARRRRILRGHGARDCEQRQHGVAGTLELLLVRVVVL